MRSALEWARVRVLAADGLSQREIAGRDDAGLDHFDHRRDTDPTPLVGRERVLSTDGVA